MECKHILARFVPCAVHSLILADVHAPSVNNAAIAFFGTVQRFFTFSSSSTSRWEMLMNVLQTSLKGHSETRWTSKASSIEALYSQIIKVCKVLNDIVENVSENPELVSTSQSPPSNRFSVFVHIAVWNPILNNTDKVNQALQSENVTVMQASKMLTGLRSTLIELREALTYESFIYAKKIAK
jgi:tRNA(Glu) U13 pseudouridine synthase TruD